MFAIIFYRFWLFIVMYNFARSCLLITYCGSGAFTFSFHQKKKKDRAKYSGESKTQRVSRLEKTSPSRRLQSPRYLSTQTVPTAPLWTCDGGFCSSWILTAHFCTFWECSVKQNLQTGSLSLHFKQNNACSHIFQGQKSRGSQIA